MFFSQVHLDNNVTNSNGYYAMPKPEYLIRTVIKNGTDLLRRSVDLQVEGKDGWASGFYRGGNMRKAQKQIQSQSARARSRVVSDL